MSTPVSLNKCQCFTDGDFLATRYSTCDYHNEMIEIAAHRRYMAVVHDSRRVELNYYGSVPNGHVPLIATLPL